MTEATPQPPKKDRMGFFDFLLEVYGVLRIVASPLLIGSGIGLGIYFHDPSTGRLVIAIVLGSIGLIIGIIWATRVWRKKGTMNYISKIYASPDLDKFDEKDE